MKKKQTQAHVCRVPKGETPVTWQDLGAIVVVVLILAVIMASCYALFSWISEVEQETETTWLSVEATPIFTIATTTPASENEYGYEYPDEDYLGGCSIQANPMFRAGVLVYANKNIGDKNLAGFFSTVENEIPTIVLRDKTIDTVAHEVFHYVDHMASEYPFDNEDRAYYQGYFTKCVYELLTP